MKKLLLTILLLAGLVGTTDAQDRRNLSGWCEDGGYQVSTDGRQSTTRVQRSFPACTVTVYDAGTVNLATIASDEAGTPKSNPFTATSRGYWNFWAVQGQYDVRFSNGGISSPFTRNNLWITTGGGGGGGAPVDATYVTLSLNGTLTQERVLTAGPNIQLTDGGANTTITVTARASAPALSIQYNSGANAFEGSASFTVDPPSNTMILGVASSATGSLLFRNSTNANRISFQAGATSSNLDFTWPIADGSAGQCLQTNGSGILSFGACGGGGGGVSGSGTPTEMAYWVGATTLGSAPAVFVNANSTIEFRRATYSLTTVLVDGATIASNWTNTNRFRVTLGGNRILSNPTNAADGQQVVYEIIQDGSGSRTLTFDSKFMFGNEITSCVVGTGANRRSYVTAIYNSSADKFSIVGCVTNYQ